MLASLPLHGIGVVVYLSCTPSFAIIFFTIFNALIICGTIILERKAALIPKVCGATWLIVAWLSVHGILSAAQGTIMNDLPRTCHTAWTACTAAGMPIRPTTPLTFLTMFVSCN